MENKHPTSALVKSDGYTTSKAFSLLQHKDGSIKTRDQIAFMQKGIKRNRIIGTIAGVGFLAFFGTNLVATLDTGNTVSLFLIGLKYLPIILVLLLIALVAFPEARARIDELTPYTEGDRAVPASLEQLVEVSSFARLEQRVKNTSRLGILTTMLIPAYMLFNGMDFLIPILTKSGSQAATLAGLIATLVVAAVSVFVVRTKHAHDKKNIAALESHYNTIRAKLESDANLKGGLSAPGPDPNAMTGGLSMTHHTDGALTETKE